MTSSLSKTTYFLGVYRPLIPNEEFNEARLCFSSETAVTAWVSKNDTTKELRVEGYPDSIASDVSRLRRYFEHAYCVLVKTPNGEGEYVSVRPRIKGGGLGVNEEDILPSYPGYALGSAIHRSEYLFPRYFRRLQLLSKEAEELKQKKDEIKTKEGKQEDRQHEILMIACQLNKIEQEQKQIQTEFDRVATEARAVNVSETLPIDYNRTQMSVYEHAFESEETNLVTFQARENGNLEERIQKFVANLINTERLSPYIGSNTLSQLAKRIEIMLGECNSITLLGSFITTKKVKKIDPIVLRQSGLSRELQYQAHQYYVLTEAVLGGLFLGFGEDHQLDSHIGIPERASRIALTSFISQGAIPEFDNQHTSLWDAFLSWRKLIKGEGTGYPIGFKVRKLVEILEENGIKYSSGENVFSEKN